jgi:hypothetical protein
MSEQTTVDPTNIKTIIQTIRAKDEAAAQAALQTEKDKFGLVALDTAAEQHIKYLEGRGPEASTVLEETAFDARDRQDILHTHPGLAPYFERHDAAGARVDDLVFAATRRLRHSRRAFAALEPSDLEPRKERNEGWLYYARWGRVSPAIFRVYEALSYTPVPADIDEALRERRNSRHAIDERLAAIAV